MVLLSVTTSAAGVAEISSATGRFEVQAVAADAISLAVLVRASFARKLSDGIAVQPKIRPSASRVPLWIVAAVVAWATNGKLVHALL